jgi:4-hydroxybenzoate polyprenyltransferase/phosphoserine phosphatase
LYQGGTGDFKEKMMTEEVIVVDLDGTLINTDLLWESLLLFIKKNPLSLFFLPIWFIQGGKALVKVKLADKVQPDIATLPYSNQLMALLKQARLEGKKLILASGSDERIVKAVSNHLGFFDESFGTTSDCNLKGLKKWQAINSYLNKKTFSYIGNEKSDKSLWAKSEKAYVVTRSKKLIRSIRKNCGEIHIFEKPGRIKAIFRALRPYQWSKNLLIFVPLFLAHQITDFTKLVSCILGFIVFSFCASAFYILNDLFDLKADRRHEKKKSRPFASGVLSIPNGLVMAFVSLAISIYLGFYFLTFQFLFILLLYCLFTLSYSLFFKKIIILDAIILSIFYTLRIFAGGIAASVEVSPWLLAFSAFFFLSLAFVKRFVELKNNKKNNIKKPEGRNYHIDDMFLIQSSGISSGFMSVLVFFIYITNSQVVRELYSNTTLLWFIGPLLIYWLNRMWFLAQRGTVDGDPVLFAIKDCASWIIGLLTILFIFLSSRI